MPVSFAFYADAALSKAIASITVFPADAPTTRMVWLASRLPGRRLVPASDAPGVSIALSGGAAASIKLARSIPGLDQSEPGAALEFSTPVAAPTPICIHIDPAAIPEEAGSVTLTLHATEEERI